jgi:hypothetical protein
MDITYTWLDFESYYYPDIQYSPQVRYDTEEYRKYFRKVFENKTFRVYQLTPDIK